MRMDKLLNFISLSVKANACMLGQNLSLAASKSGKVKLFILSTDATQNTKKQITNSANFYKIPVIEVYEKNLLGKAVGKELISVLGIKDDGFAKQILKLYSEKIDRGNV